MFPENVTCAAINESIPIAAADYSGIAAKTELWLQKPLHRRTMGAAFRGHESGCGDDAVILLHSADLTRNSTGHSLQPLIPFAHT